ncbi:unnamed protein product, partial [Nesidiocoris tenuis]
MLAISITVQKNRENKAALPKFALKGGRARPGQLRLLGQRLKRRLTLLTIKSN